MDIQLRKLERELNEDPIILERLAAFLEKHFDVLENSKIRQLAGRGMALIGGQGNGIFAFDEQRQEYYSSREHRDLWRKLLKLHNRACRSKKPYGYIGSIPAYSIQEPLYDNTPGEKCVGEGCNEWADPDRGMCTICKPWRLPWTDTAT